MERLTVMYEGLEVPKKACTFDRGGYPDDCKGCEDICEDAGGECGECILQECMTRLGEYEKTELTPPEIMELKEWDKAENITEEEFHGVKFYSCPICNEPVHEKDNFCCKCGRRLKKEE